MTETSEAVERLTELAVGWEFAVLSEQAVMDRFQADMDRFSANERSPELLRTCRVYVDARSNLERFTKDAAALRSVLASNEKLVGALREIVDESVFNQQRFAEDDDTDYFLRCFKAVKDAARQALRDAGVML